MTEISALFSSIYVQYMSPIIYYAIDVFMQYILIAIKLWFQDN